MAKHVAGPVFLVKPGGNLLPGTLTVSHCLGIVTPDTWAIDWVKVTDAERAEGAARSDISLDRLPEVISWTTERFEHGFAWSHAFLDLGLAQEFRRRFLPDTFRILQIGLPESLLASFLQLAAPPGQRPGYAPNGSTGAYQALSRGQLLPTGTQRGFEVLGYDRYGGGFDSFRCVGGLEQDFVKLGASFNEWGLIADDTVALRCAEFANGPDVGTCADGWHPWLVVEHAS